MCGLLCGSPVEWRRAVTVRRIGVVRAPRDARGPACVPRLIGMAWGEWQGLRCSTCLWVASLTTPNAACDLLRCGLLSRRGCGGSWKRRRKPLRFAGHSDEDTLRCRSPPWRCHHGASSLPPRARYGGSHQVQQRSADSVMVAQSAVVSMAELLTLMSWWHGTMMVPLAVLDNLVLTTLALFGLK